MRPVGKWILRALGVIVMMLVLFVAVVTWGPYLTTKDAPAPRAVYVRSFGEGQLDQPIGVTVSAAGEIFVSDAGNQRIAVFDTEGRLARALGQEGEGPGELDRPMHLTIGPDGLLYVAEYLNDRISVFRTDGTFVRQITPGRLDAPAGIAVGKDGVLYVADFYHHVVRTFDPGGALQANVGAPGRVRRGSLHYPTDVEIAPDGTLWVADAYNNRLQRFAHGRAQDVAGWGTFGLAFGFKVADGVGVDARGRVYGTDFYRGRIRVFDGDGTPLEVFGKRGHGPGELDRPSDIAFHGDRAFVVDFGNNRVQEWRIEGVSPAK